VATVGHTGNPGNTRHDYVPPLNNETLFRRDAYLCLYCGERHSSRELSRDHVRPFSQGGRDVWTNVVAACRSCNNYKAWRTPEQAKLQLIAVPFMPTYAEYIFGPARARRPDGISAGALSAQQPAARAHRTLAQLARSWRVVISSTRRPIFRAWYSQQPEQRDGDGNPTDALYGFARFLAI
jgi:hypothetical protein